MARTVEVLLLDLDDTLVESEARNVDLYRSFVERLGIAPDPADLEIVVGSAATDIFAHIRRRYPVETSGLDLTSAFLKYKRENIGALPLRQATGLSRLLSLPHQKALVSGSLKLEIDMVLQSAGISHSHFDVVLGSEDFRIGKPDPAGYLMALDRLGVSPDRALVVEDSPQGVRSGWAAGATVVFVEESAHTHVQADFRVPTLQHLYGILRTY